MLFTIKELRFDWFLNNVQITNNGFCLLFKRFGKVRKLNRQYRGGGGEGAGRSENFKI